MPQVAFSKDFWDAVFNLPKPVQKKVREFMDKFRRDPTSPGINFERIQQAIDPNARSVRIDQAHRAIVIHPPKDDVYLCVWVDKHDEAYRWVRHRRFEVNPKSGVFQVFDLEAIQPAPVAGGRARTGPTPTAAGLFLGVADEDLGLAGLPAPLIPSVRAVRSEADLDALAPHLPEDVADVLYGLASGLSLAEALAEAEKPAEPPKAVDVNDFQTALQQPDSKRIFRIIEDEWDLDTIFTAPLEKWRVFLHPTQDRLVRMKANGPIKVLGGAGTGKTVALMHRARHLAREVFTEPDDRILVTTFTKNLALDLARNLRNLCGPEFERLEILHLHRWAARFMRTQGVRFQIASAHDQDEMWQTAFDQASGPEFPLSFYREEWDQVVVQQNVRALEEYLVARRLGRGTRLDRRKRVDVWNVLNQYRELLDARGVVEWQDLVRETHLYIEKGNISLPYRAVLADEVQDLSPNELRLLRALVRPGPNDLFLVGDGHQRIYGQRARLSACGIEVRGRSRRLKLNYRTTQQIKTYAVAILEGCEIDDLDEGTDSLKGFWSLRRGVVPDVRHLSREGDEATFIVGKVREWLAEGVPAEAICLVARTKELVHDRYRAILDAAHIAATIVTTDPEAEAALPGVRLATMHRMKGLEFLRVIVAGVQEGTVPLTRPDTDFPDETSRRHHELQERCLLYVACTRARDALVVCGYGSKSALLPDTHGVGR